MGFGDELLDAAIGPDGLQLVFVATSNGTSQLWRRTLSEDRATAIPGTEGARLPAWKQTGNVVSFFSGTSLKQIALADGQVSDLAQVASPAGAAWLADGSLLYADGRRPLQQLREGRVSAATTFVDGDLAHGFPMAAGASDFIYVAVRQDGRRIVRLVSEGQHRDLTATSGHAVLIGGYLLHVRDGALLRYQYDAETGALSHQGVPLALNVGVAPDGRALFAASPRLLLHAPAAVRARQLVWLDAEGMSLGTAGDVGGYWQVRLSPDDRFAAITTTAPLLRTLDILVMPTAGAGDTQRLTSSIAADTDPVWSPDGTRVLFRTLQAGQPNLVARRAHTAGAVVEPIRTADGDETPTDWNGRDVLFHARPLRPGSGRGDGGLDVLRLDTRTGATGPLLGSGFNESDARWSRDGAWMTYVADDSGQPDIYARRADGMRVVVSSGGGVRPRWSRDGRRIFFVRGSQMMRADLVTGDVPRFASPRAVFEARGIIDFDVAHSSDRFLAILPVDRGMVPPVSGVLNWMSIQ
jgi:Tol biopolymer transport system component